MNVHLNTILRYNRRPASAQVVCQSVLPDYPPRSFWIRPAKQYSRPKTGHLPLQKRAEPLRGPQFDLVADEVEKVNSDLIARDVNEKALAMKPTRDVAQKKKELSWFLIFQEQCLDCPRSIPDQSEGPAPDLIFSEHDLGIEVTEYLLGQGKGGSHPRRLENVRRKIVRDAQSEYERNISHCLEVSVSWATTDCPTKREEKAISQALAWLVAMRMSGSGRSWRISWEQFDQPILAKYVAEVRVYLMDDHGQGCWSSVPAFWLWEAKQRVQAALNEKEPKISAYRKFCRELWLLIVADQSWLSSRFFPDYDFANAIFHSSFDRAFLLDASSASVYKVKIEHQGE
jgi:hypothetical protein